jgi:hypothetical protein
MKRAALVMAIATVFIPSAAPAGYVVDDWGASAHAQGGTGRSAGVCGQWIQFPSPQIPVVDDLGWNPCFNI